MGETLHRTVIITLNPVLGDGENDEALEKLGDLVHLDEIRQSMPDHLRGLFIGPFHGLANGYCQFFFVTSGSNAGRNANIEHEWWCRVLLEEFPNDAILVTHGDEPPKLEVTHRLRRKNAARSSS